MILHQLCDWPGCIHIAEIASCVAGGGVLCHEHLECCRLHNDQRSVMELESLKAVLRVAEVRNSLAPE